jgi:hypothetical protein
LWVLDVCRIGVALFLLLILRVLLIFMGIGFYAHLSYWWLIDIGRGVSDIWTRDSFHGLGD